MEESKSRTQLLEENKALKVQVEDLKKQKDTEHTRALHLSETNEQMKRTFISRMQEATAAVNEANKEEYYTNLNWACRIIENKQNYKESVVTQAEQIVDEHLELIKESKEAVKKMSVDIAKTKTE